jgi:hypothetical protein
MSPGPISSGQQVNRDLHQASRRWDNPPSIAEAAYAVAVRAAPGLPG